MPSRPALQSLIVALVLTGCGSDGLMKLHLDSIGNNLDSEIAGLAAHKDGVAAATTLAAINTVEGAYATKLKTVAEETRMLVTELKDCKKDSVPPDTTVMSTASWEVVKEASAHLNAMTAAANVDEARAEEERFQAKMTEQLDVMMAGHMSLMKISDSYTCVMTGHTH